MQFLESNKCLDSCQRGFTKNSSTATNIKDLALHIMRVKQQCIEERKQKVKRSQRATNTLLFVDLEKAFDRVNRGRLVDKLEDLQIPQYIINACKSLLSNTVMRINEEECCT